VAGVEPATRVENTQLTDSEIASNAENATISKSAVQSLYKVCQEFPELQPSNFPAPCKSTLKRSCSISDFGRCMLQRNPRQFLNAFSFGFFQCAEQEDRLQVGISPNHFRGRIRRHSLRIRARDRIIWPKVGFERTTLLLTARHLHLSGLLSSALYCAFSAVCDREALDHDCGDYPLLPTILKEYPHKIPHSED
jgi:hypothetical protein